MARRECRISKQYCLNNLDPGRLQFSVVLNLPASSALKREADISVFCFEKEHFEEEVKVSFENKCMKIFEFLLRWTVFFINDSHRMDEWFQRLIFY